MKKLLLIISLMLVVLSSAVLAGYVQISPANPTANDDLSCSYAGQTAGLGFVWTVEHNNDVNKHSNENSAVLTKDKIHAGDRVTCEVYAIGARDLGILGWATVTIAEAAPKVEPLKFEFVYPKSNQKFSVDFPVMFLIKVSGGYPDRTYIWDFGNGNVVKNDGKENTLFRESAIQFYKKPGKYKVSVTVSDGRTAITKSVNIEIYQKEVVVPNQAPIAVILADKLTAYEWESIRFDGSKSFDSDGRIVSYAWDFGDGSTATGDVISHVFARAGSYVVRLTVTDDDGAKASASISMNIKENVVVEETYYVKSLETYAGGLVSKFSERASEFYRGAPVYAAFKIVNSKGKAADNIKVEVYILDSKGNKIYLKPYSGIGSFGYISDGQPVFSGLFGFSHTGLYYYYLPKVPLENDDILNRNNPLLVILKEKKGVGARRDVVLKNNEVVLGNIPDREIKLGEVAVVGLDGFAFDFETPREQLVWSVRSEGRGIVASSISDRQLVVDGTSEGTEALTVRVDDRDGSIREDRVVITVVKEEPENIPPVAVLDAENVNPIVGRATGFDGSRSFDSDGRIVSYDWSFGDGGVGSGASVQHSFAQEGTYVVRLTVTDDDGATGTTSVRVRATREIIVNQAPDAVIDADRTVINEGESVNFDASRSSDSDGRIASYEWSFGDGSNGSGVNVAHTFVSSGVYSVTLVVRDDDGDMDSASVQIIVNQAPIVPQRERMGKDNIGKQKKYAYQGVDTHDFKINSVRPLYPKNVFKKGDVVQLVVDVVNEGNVDEELELELTAFGRNVVRGLPMQYLTVGENSLVSVSFRIPQDAGEGYNFVKVTADNTENSQSDVAYWTFRVA